MLTMKIDFSAAYDTITKNNVTVVKSKLDLLTFSVFSLSFFANA